MQSPEANLPTPTVRDPITYWMAHGLKGPGRTRARGGYICYAPNCPDNLSAYYPGWGPTERDALLNACYWSNQAPLIRVVPLARAPKWAVDLAHGHDKGCYV